MSVAGTLSRFAFLGLVLLAPAAPAWSQEEPSAPTTKDRRSWMILSDQDAFVPITSVEWGTPDRWSFTARYVHFFQRDRDHKPWLHNLTVALSPGTDGGRLGVGYQGIVEPDSSKPDWAMFIEARAVLLRTWGNPLEAEADRTYVGAEIRFAPIIFLNIGGGYYWPASSSGGSRDPFWGYHIGIGI